MREKSQSKCYDAPKPLFKNRSVMNVVLNCIDRMLDQQAL